MRNIVLFSLTLGLGLTACSKSEDEIAPPSGSPPAGGGSITAPADSAPAIAPPPAATPPPSAAPGAAPAPATSGGKKDEYNGEVVTRDDDGNRLEGLAFLKKAMMLHVEGKGNPYPTRIEELVELGTLKSLPPAPAGQKWMIDPTTKQIVAK